MTGKAASRGFGLSASYLLLALICSLGYAVTFAQIFAATAEMLFCSLLHAALAAIVTYKIVVELFVTAKHRLSLAAMFIVVNLIYFNASSLKYFETELYPGFISNNFIRLMYSILALLVLWFSYEFIVRQKPNRLQPIVYVKHSTLLKIVLVAILGFNCFAMYRNYQQKGIGYVYNLDATAEQLALERTEMTLAEKMRMWLLGSSNMIVILLVTILQVSRNAQKYIVLAIFVYLINSFVSGNRSGLFYYVIFLGFSLAYLYGYKSKLFAKILISAPLAIGLGSIAVLTVSGRVSSDYRDGIKRQLAYRFDLTDYAATIMLSNDAAMFNIGQIADAVYYSVPRVFYSEKYEANKKSVLKLSTNANLNEDDDYTDTYFSIGSQLAGFIGFVLFPFLMILFLYGVEQQFYRWLPAIAAYLTVFISPWCLIAEGDLNAILANWRMLPLYVLLCAVLCGLFVRANGRAGFKALEEPKRLSFWRATAARIVQGYQDGLR